MPGPSRPRSGDTPPRIAQRLVAVPWRHAGLIALCAVAGGLASTLPWLRQPPAHVVAARTRVQAIQGAPPSRPSETGAGVDLRLDLDPGAAAALADAARAVDAPQGQAPALQLDDARQLDEIDAALRLAPPAAGGLMRPASERAPASADGRRNATLPGLAAGLLLGLLVAGLRELRGQRMRSPREAEWALGAPVLGAIPTLSARARGALFEPTVAAPDSA